MSGSGKNNCAINHSHILMKDWNARNILVNFAARCVNMKTRMMTIILKDLESFHIKVRIILSQRSCTVSSVYLISDSQNMFSCVSESKKKRNLSCILRHELNMLE